MINLKINYKNNSTELCEIGRKYDTDKSPQRDNVTNILQAEFKLQELKAKSLFIIVPKSCQAKNLLKLLQEYIQLMESIRFSLWMSKVEPKDFNKHIKDLDLDQK